MADIKIHRLTNANVFADGNSMLGRVESINSPTVTWKQSEHKALGMIGTNEYASGLDKMEGTIKWNSIYGDVVSLFSNPFKPIRLQVRGNVEEISGGAKLRDIPSVIYMTVTAKNIPTGGYQQHDNVELETAYNCTYLKVVIDNVTVLEVDIEANILKVGGVDLLAQYRQNLGI